MFDEWIPMPRYKLRKHLIRKILQTESIENRTCLEIGYGAGDMLLMYAKMGLKVDGYDFSPIAYQYAKTRITKNIRLFEHEDDIQENFYDYLFAFEVIEHIQEDEKALQRFGNYLKVNGRIILSVPSHMSKWGNNDICTGHYRRYEKNELKKKLYATNFNFIYLWNYGFPVCLALDMMLHRSCKKNLEVNRKTQREELSKVSGVKRKKTIFNQLVSSDVVLFPFYVLQSFFLNRDLGSGYLVLAEKSK